MNDFGPLSLKAMFLDGVDHNLFALCPSSSKIPPVLVSKALVSKQWEGTQ